MTKETTAKTFYETFSYETKMMKTKVTCDIFRGDSLPETFSSSPITKGGDNRNRRPNLFQNLDPVGRKLQDSINLLQQSIQEGPEQLGKREQTTTRRIRCINNIALLMQLRMNNIINYLNQSSGKRSSRFLMQYSKLRCFCLKKCY